MRDWIDSDYIKTFGKIIGVDEAGRGPLAGPVVAAAVYLTAEQEQLLNDHIPFLNDSKQISEKKRNIIFDFVVFSSIKFGIGISSESVIDTSNILLSTNNAMNNAIERLGVPHDMALIDGKNLTISCQNRQIVKGDSLSMRIALASNIAKVIRDRILIAFSRLYPHYGFNKNKGYGTKSHVQALMTYGATPFHRISFNPVYKNITVEKLTQWKKNGMIESRRFDKILHKCENRYQNEQRALHNI